MKHKLPPFSIFYNRKKGITTIKERSRISGRGNDISGS
nr:MAG TPA: hypothetical protein [Caudoviricetes sp.]